MSFDKLEFQHTLFSTDTNPVTSFFVPVLHSAVRYDVAVGYFTSSWMREAAEGIAQFASNGGRSRWVISPNISKKDYEVLRDSSGEFNENQLDLLASRTFKDVYDGLLEDTRVVLGWLIRDQVVKFRIAIPQKKLSGMMHAKMGIFYDSEGHQIGYSGSYNHTGSAESNWETIDVFCSWKSQESNERIQGIANKLTGMWEGSDTNLHIYCPSDKSLKPFIYEAQQSPRPYKLKSNESPSFEIPQQYLINGKLRGYQIEAIDAWFKNNGKGILSMATGSGKTVVSLAIVSKLSLHGLEESQTILVIVTVPYQHLADQWAKEAQKFGFDPVVCYGNSNKWLSQATHRITGLHSNIRSVEMMVAVNDTFRSARFQGLIKKCFRMNVFLVADEVHNLGSQRNASALLEEIPFRLGLSATPIRYSDEEGTEILEQYFGGVVYEFSLKNAIDNHCLCQYEYYPILAPLNEYELEEYKEISKSIARLYVTIKDDSEISKNQQIKSLLIRRARLISQVESKLKLLQQILMNKSDSSFNLIYCGDSIDCEGRQVDKVLRLVGVEIGMHAAKFTADENSSERQELMSRFSNAELQALVAIRCLDEGIDIPKTETAYILASSRNPRQYIQRRGRVLRRAPGKKIATIYDFVAVPDLTDLSEKGGENWKSERYLLRRELERVNEFAELSINKGHALAKLRELKKQLNLMDI